MVVRTHCDILLLQSASVLNSYDVSNLIKKVEDNCDSLASLIAANKACSPEDVKKNISDALEKWEKAKIKLEDHISLYKEQKD